MQGLSPYRISKQLNFPLNIIRGIRERGNFNDIFVDGYIEWEKENPARKLQEHFTKEEVIEIKSRLITGESKQRIADRLEIDVERIYKIERGLTYSHIKVTGFSPKSVHPLWNTGSNKPNTKLTEELIPLIRVLHKRKTLLENKLVNF